MAKVSRRLIPFLIICYFVAYLDRTNVSFAALTMRRDLNISDAAYGLGAGIFFFTYFIFEVPSNLALERFGARKWIARIMLTWGILSGCMAIIGGEWGFYIVRLLLGAAEAGFFPGIIFYLTLWFPSVYRARIVGYFMAAIPGSAVLGAPLSALLLYLDGVAGLAGWKWMFILEAVPAVILSVVTWVYLTDRPSDAHWLEPEERTWLSERLAAEQRQRLAAQHFTVTQALLNPRVMALAFIYFGTVATNYGVSFWLPQIIQSFGGLSKIEIGIITAIPYAIGLVGMVWWGKRSDIKLERKFHAAFACFVAGFFIALSTAFANPTLKMVCLSIAGFGVFAVLPVFWTFPTAFLSGAAAAAGIAIINALGNLAGFAGPYVMGWIKQETNSFSGGLLFVGACGLAAMVIVLLLPHESHLERAPEEEHAHEYGPSGIEAPEL
ncbi:MAG: MFS transporter [Acetobacteraceae bacterium]|nr:MFS transporter [Acetobacteraceae bacterium]MBV8522884.1 MFS transporter [Acetobacteraceae bacterium]